MFCAISGNSPEHPVVSKTGHLFEQSVIEKYIEATGKCPVTGEELSAADLLPVKTSSTVKPRPLAATSIPGMLTLFQNEWDAVMLETYARPNCITPFSSPLPRHSSLRKLPLEGDNLHTDSCSCPVRYTLKQQLDTVRQELGHALYQHDAACRVIARLIKERDDARKALAEAQPSPANVASAASAATAATAASIPNGSAASAPMEVESPSGMPTELAAKFQETSQTLAKGRKKRQPVEGQASAEAIAEYRTAFSQAVFSAGSVCVDVHLSLPLAAVGGADGSAFVFDCTKGSTGPQLKGHTGRITSVRLHPSKPLALTSSADTSARVWSTEGRQLHELTGHTAEVSSCTLHASGEYCITASMDKTWALFDLERGAMVFRVPEGVTGYGPACSFPGMHVRTSVHRNTDRARAAEVVRIWDVKSQANVASFEGHTGVVNCLAFSENGYYLATGSEDATVKIWDLRKLKNIRSISEKRPAPISSLAFDNFGAFLAVGGGEGISIYESKGWSLVKSFDAQSVTGVGFGKAAATVVAGSGDGVVKVYSAESL
ncbi:MAG: hypothetical protein SGPRY_008412 [Prymnesium sp.]